MMARVTLFFFEEVFSKGQDAFSKQGGHRSGRGLPGLLPLEAERAALRLGQAGEYLEHLRASHLAVGCE